MANNILNEINGQNSIQKKRIPVNKRLDVDSHRIRIIEYYRSGFPINLISTLFNCSSYVVTRILNESNIELKNGPEYIKGKPAWNRKILEESSIVNLYKNGFSAEKISKKFNCHQCTILDILERNKVDIKPPEYYRLGTKLSEETILKIKYNAANNPLFGMKGKTQTLEHRKKNSATKQGISLDKWSKFTHEEEYDYNWTHSFKNKIRQRDNQVCMNCGIHREKLKQALSIHHVNYDKLCSIEQNCISLCRICHSLNQINRDYWTQLFQEKLSKLYGYKYQDGKIILNLDKSY